MSGCRLSRAADDDLADIFWQGLERFGPNQTELYLSGLEEQHSYLARFPEAARLRTDLTPAVRAHPYRAHVLIYEVDDDGVLVLRVRAARENWMTSPLGG